ncbi:MAG TPA: polyphenol oxidase family protein, partial [Candidatus Binataceae bacterium]|nr:polyphenol oxidase family protein [Candidatus Binataceae bacterium]
MNTSFHSRPISPPPTVVPWNFEGVTAGFFGRRGGVSAGAFAELNLSHAVGDDPGAVAANWNAARSAFGKDFRIARVRQVHGNIVHRMSRDFGKSILEGDAMVTSEPGVMLGILTADCVPILMIDRHARVAGAVHAGWRGVIAGIVEKSVDAMVSAGASRDRIQAALGPAIDQCCFEV